MYHHNCITATGQTLYPGYIKVWPGASSSPLFVRDR